jgi:hypothetical protein
MKAFSENSLLNKSSLNHAIYLYSNKVVSHNETLGAKNYTGNSPSDRAVAAGYSTRFVGENIAYESGSTRAVDGLMSAIYHRFGFLSFDYDEIGYGNSGSNYVYNMGNSHLAILCEGPTYSGYGLIVSGACAKDIILSDPDYSGAIDKVRIDQPDFIVWPYNEQTGVSPVFYEEEPDPLPDFGVSGYPVSIQFNPLQHGKINMTSYKLWIKNSSDEIPVRILQASNDPNKKFSNQQFALFPLYRLNWDTTYVAQFNFTENNMAKFYTWEFSTKNLGVLVYTVTQSPATISIAAGTDKVIAVYIPPVKGYNTIGGINWTYTSGTNVSIDYEDQNTLIIHISGVSGNEVKVNYHNGSKNFSILLN